MASSEIIQFFDSKGNPVSFPRAKIPYETKSVFKRFSIPEGIELRKDIKHEFYPVFGKTFSEVVRSTEENGPRNIKENKHYKSKLEWKFGWSYKFRHTQKPDIESQDEEKPEDADQHDEELVEESRYDQAHDEENKTLNVALDIYDINISYDISITLPTLLDDSALNPIEKSMWKNYLQKIINYEYDHVKIIEDLATKEAIIKSIKDIDYIVFDFKKDVDIEKVAESFLRDETAKLGRYWADRIKIRYDEYNRATQYGLKPELRESFFK